MSIRLAKFHGLGNDYLVLNPADYPGQLTPERIRFICDRHLGAGSDGILLGPLPAEGSAFGLRIFNPDGSEAEKSGNGLRIFARYLWEQNLVGEAPFTVLTAGGQVRCQVLAQGEMVRVEMGNASFASQHIPVSGPERLVINEPLRLANEQYQICALSLGNPHCVLLDAPVSPETARRLGPLVENHLAFPRRTNVQFLQVLDRRRLRIEIWERGAGYTLASGSSSCAAAAAAYQLGWCDDQVEVHMPGGVLQVSIDPRLGLVLLGPVVKVWEGFLWLDGENLSGNGGDR